jgi:DNA-binding NarL/FixJ family response regulator
MDRSLQQDNEPLSGRSLARTLADRPAAEVARVIKTEAINVVIADNHVMFREGLRMLLHSNQDFRVVGEAGEGVETIRMIRERKPDVLLLDLAMPRSMGLDVLQELVQMSIPVRTIVLTAAIEASQMEEAIRLGARAVILTESASEVLFECIRSVMAGRYWIGNQKVSEVVQALRRLLPPAGAERRINDFGVTRRELEVIDAIVAGYTNRDMAHKFSISEQTVKHHLTNIFDKLGVSNRLELLLFAVEHHLTGNSRAR